MANTYEKIASVTVGSGGAANIEFTSIPGTFDDLLLLVSARSNRTGTVWDALAWEINGTAANLLARLLQADGSAASSNAQTALNGYFPTAATTANTFGNIQAYFPNYAGSTNKSFSVDCVTENNATSALMNLGASINSSTSAITSFKMITNAGSFVQHSSATLYGIKKS